PIAPAWTKSATHAIGFRCPACGETPAKAQRVWLNRRSPVFMENYKRKWQEFYHCECGCAWWGWSNERPPNELAERDRESDEDSSPPNFPNPFM
ncbi:MAG: hypothetical protein AAGF75_11375, partial [Cyanobacteria bacterium P01_H01_bin.130]